MKRGHFAGLYSPESVDAPSSFPNQRKRKSLRGAGEVRELLDWRLPGFNVGS